MVAAVALLQALAVAALLWQRAADPAPASAPAPNLTPQHTNTER
jgi:hypothetical protein